MKLLLSSVKCYMRMAILPSMQSVWFNMLLAMHATLTALVSQGTSQYDEL